jgi:hypothetical protein
MNSPSPTAISEVQAKEKEAKRAYQRDHRAKQARIRRKKKKDAKEFMETCPKTSRDIIPPRQARATKRAATKKVPSSYQLYMELIDKLKTFRGDFRKQQSLLVQWGKIRWMEHRRLPLLRLEQRAGPEREVRHFTMQITASADWEDLLEVKASSLTSSQPGLGLFACRPFQSGAVISLFGGVPLDQLPPKEVGSEYHMRSSKLNLILDAQGPVDQAAPFLGAQMVNDPTWLPPLIPGEEPPKRSSLESMANCKFCSDFTLVATKPIKKGQEFLTLYDFTQEEESEESKDEESSDEEKEDEAEEESDEEERDNEEKKKKAKKPSRRPKK